MHLLLGEPMFQLLVGLCSCTDLGMHVSFILNERCVRMYLSLIPDVDNHFSSFLTNVCVCVCVCVCIYICMCIGVCVMF